MRENSMFTLAAILVVVSLVKQKKYTFNCTVSFELVSKFLKCLKTLTNQILLQNMPKKMLTEPHNDGKVTHFPLPH